MKQQVTENLLPSFFPFFSAQPSIILFLFHISQDSIGQITSMSELSKVNEYLTFVFSPVVLQHVNTSTLSDVNSKRFSSKKTQIFKTFVFLVYVRFQLSV